MNLYTPGNPYVRPGTSWPQSPKPYQVFNQPRQQFTNPVPQGPQYTVQPQQLPQPQPLQSASLPQTQNNGNSEFVDFLRQQGLHLAQKYGPYIIREVGTPIIRTVTPQIAEKLAPPLAEKVVLPLITRVGFPIARR